MDSDTPQKMANFVVSPMPPHRFKVCEKGFEKPIAEFDDIKTAEEYALRMAETKTNWTVEVFDQGGQMIGTYNSDDDAMPKPPLN